MSFEKLVVGAQTYFPDLKIKFKDESLLMKILSKILFFNKNFMTNYTTTIGSSVYFPSKSYLEKNERSAIVVLLHELVHLQDAKKYNNLLFGFLYLTPQILALLFFPLLFISWKIALFFLIFAFPIPSYFRMYFERRAYMASLYCINEMSKKMNFQPLLLSNSIFFLNQFKSSNYYFMWMFKNLEAQFNEAIEKIKKNEKPFEDPVFSILDKLILDL